MLPLSPGVAVTPVCHPPFHSSRFSLALSCWHLLSVVSSNFSFSIFFLNQRPLTPREHRVRCQTTLPASLLCSSAPRAGFVSGEQPRPLGCCSLVGSVPQPEPRLWALLAHSTLSPTAPSNQHPPVLETGLTAQPLLLPRGFCTGHCHLNTFFWLFFHRHFSPFFIAAFVL